MNTLNDYVDTARTELFNSTGAFFAFSQDQLEENRQEGVVYCSLGAGLIAPKSNAKALIDGLEEIHRQGIEQDLADNGKQAIINRELANHECYYTDDVTDCVEALSGYGITIEEIHKVFHGGSLSS